MSNSYIPRNIDVPAEDIRTRLGITNVEINENWKIYRDKLRYQSLLRANMLVLDVVHEAFLHVSNGGEQLNQNEAVDLIKKALEDGWFRKNMYPFLSQDELYGDERLCSLLAQAGEIAVSGFHKGLWKDESSGVIE